MIELGTLLPVALAFFVVTVSPGPANVAVATVAMRLGRDSGLLFGAGLSVGLAIWGVVAATGMGAVLQGSAMLLTTLKIAGGLYLLWLAFLSGRSARTGGAGVSPDVAPGRWFLRGLVLNLSNPKAVVAWIAALSMGLGAGDGLPEVAAATLICALLGVLNYTGHALAFSLPPVMAWYLRCARWIDGVVAGLFAVAGLGLIRSAFQR